MPGPGGLVLFFAFACGFGFQCFGFGLIQLRFDGFAFFGLIDKLPNGVFQSCDIAIRTELDGCVGFWEKHDAREGKTRQQKDIDTCAENVVCFHLRFLFLMDISEYTKRVERTLQTALSFFEICVVV